MLRPIVAHLDSADHSHRVTQRFPVFSRTHFQSVMFKAIDQFKYWHFLGTHYIFYFLMRIFEWVTVVINLMKFWKYGHQKLCVVASSRICQAYESLLQAWNPGRSSS